MKKIYGLYGQELNVGDKIVFCAKSYGSCYMRAGAISSIDTSKGFIRVKITYPFTEMIFDEILKKYVKSDYIKYRTSRIYNWRSSVTLTDEQYDKIITKELTWIM
jgi:hypothetical protein